MHIDAYFELLRGFNIVLFICILIFVSLPIDILKAIKNATGTSVIFPINITLIHFVFVLTSVPNVEERFTQT